MNATGLTKVMSGPEFEEQLGNFLRQVVALPLIESVLEPSLKFQGPVHGITNGQSLKTWHSQTIYHLGQIVQVIHESLYAEFGPERCSYDTAGEAYGALFDALGVTGTDKVVYATTNYDGIGEAALQKIGRFPDWGEFALLDQTRSSAEPPLKVDGLLDGLPRYTPVLHLHGKVGWYRREGTGAAYVAGGSRFDAGFGIPIIMLPDPKKRYDVDDVIVATWSEFTQALQRARRVLILGHSLNDVGLVNALRDHVQSERIGVCVFGNEDCSEPDPSAANSIACDVRQSPSSRTPMYVRFGEDPSLWTHHLHSWVEETEESLQEERSDVYGT